MSKTVDPTEANFTAVDLSSLTRYNDTISVSDIDDSPFNPKSRTEDDARKGIAELAESLIKNGQLEPGTVIKTVSPEGLVRYILVNAHRRKAAMKLVGIELMNVTIYEPGPYPLRDVHHALFVSININNMNMKNRAHIEIAFKDGPVFDAKAKSTVKQLNEIYPQGVPESLKTIAGTYSLSVAKRIVSYCWPHYKRNGAAFKREVAPTLLWMFENQQQQNAISYIRNKFSEDRFRNAIKKGKPVPGYRG